MRDKLNLRSKFLGGMIGTALGDAIGELAFRVLGEAGLRSAIQHTDVLVYTDDTAMAIGLAESITQFGGLDPQHLGDTFRSNFKREPWRGYATGPPTIFRLVERRAVSYVQAARSLFAGQGSFGNGAAMRIAPVGLLFHDSPDLYERVRASACVTHAHPVGVDGAAVLARAIAEAVKQTPAAPFPIDNVLRALVAFARTPEIRDRITLVRRLVADDVPPPEAAGILGRGVAVHESLPFATYAFLRHPDSFEACLLCAVLNGGDRDTLGAMACAISGAYLGATRIPPVWREKIENRGYIESLAIRLFQMT